MKLKRKYKDLLAALILYIVIILGIILINARLEYLGMVIK